MAHRGFKLDPMEAIVNSRSFSPRSAPSRSYCWRAALAVGTWVAAAVLPDAMALAQSDAKLPNVVQRILERPEPPAPAGSAAAFVKLNGQRAIDLIGKDAISYESRQVAFSELIVEATDVRAIARFVLGRYARRFNEEQLARYYDIYQTYMIAVYEAQFQTLSAESMRLRSVIERRPDDYIIETLLIIPENARQPILPVKWRVMKRDGAFRIIDAEVFGIWLAIQQRADFEAVFERSDGDPEALLAAVQRSIERLRVRAAAAQEKG